MAVSHQILIMVTTVVVMLVAVVMEAVMEGFGWLNRWCWWRRPTGFLWLSILSVYSLLPFSSKVKTCKWSSLLARRWCWCYLDCWLNINDRKHRCLPGYHVISTSAHVNTYDFTWATYSSDQKEKSYYPSYVGTHPRYWDWWRSFHLGVISTSTFISILNSHLKKSSHKYPCLTLV